MTHHLPVPAEIVDIFDELGDEPAVSYPPLTRDELLALGDAPLLNDTDDAAWWGGLAEHTRTEVLASAQRGLLARGMVNIDARDTARLDVVSPRVRRVLALRSVPAFVTLIGNSGHPSPVLRCYGVLGPHERSAVLIEARLITGVAEYAISTTRYAATVAARVLLAAPDADDPDAVEGPEELGGRVVRRRLEMFPPGRLDNGRRFVAFAGTTSGAVATVDGDGHAADPHEMSEHELVELIEEGWRGDAAAAFAELAAPEDR